MAFSDTILFSETLACLEPPSCLRRRSPPAQRSCGTRSIYWGWGLGVQARFRLKRLRGSRLLGAGRRPARRTRRLRAAAPWAQSGWRLHVLLGRRGPLPGLRRLRDGASQRLCLLSCCILRTAQASSSSLGSGAGGRGPSASSTLSSLSGASRPSSSVARLRFRCHRQHYRSCSSSSSKVHKVQGPGWTEQPRSSC